MTINEVWCDRLDLEVKTELNRLYIIVHRPVFTYFWLLLRQSQPAHTLNNGSWPGRIES